MNIAIVSSNLIIVDLLVSILERSIPGCNTKLVVDTASFLAFNFNPTFSDVVILDLLLSPNPEQEVIEHLTQSPNSRNRLIVLSASKDLDQIKWIIRAGVKGYVGNDSSLTELVLAVSDVAENKLYITQSIKENLFSYALTDQVSDPLLIKNRTAQNVIDSLTRREKDILNQICAGNTPSEIALITELKLSTVRIYIKNLLRKFNVKRIPNLVILAFKHGLYKYEE